MAAPPSRRSARSQHLVAAIVENPELVQLVRELEPAALGAIVRHVGLEDSGSLLALATSDQLRGLADDDLWRQVADSESFDDARFALWLEVLVEESPRAAADALLSLDEDLLSLALTTRMLVLDLDAIAPLMADGELALEDAELVDKMLESQLSHEFDQFLVLALRYDGWDAFIEVIHAIEQRDDALVRRVLERACEATMDRVAEDGLYTVLSQAQTLEEDALSEREIRREQRGFVTPADALSFLRGAQRDGASVVDNPGTRSYFRTFRATPSARAPSVNTELLSLLRHHGVTQQHRALGSTTSGQSKTRSLLAQMREANAPRHQELSAELLYLASTLMACASLDTRPIDRVEAIHVALVMCDAGREISRSKSDDSLVPMFGAGWRAASEDDERSEDRSPALAEARALRRRIGLPHASAGGQPDL